jgi:hypothetical protein
VITCFVSRFVVINMKIAVLFVVLLQVTYQGLVYSDFHSHFGNFLAWKAQRN